MREIQERRTVNENVPVNTARPAVDTRYASVVREDRGMSGGAVAALVLAAVAAAVVIMIVIMNNQQRNSDQELAQERAKSAAAEQAPTPAAPQAPSQPQQPPVIVVPQSQPATVPAGPQATAAPTANTSLDIEVGVNSKLLEDRELRSYAIDVKASGGTITLAGHVPTEALKARAEKLARTVKGVGSVANNIVVRPD